MTEGQNGYCVKIRVLSSPFNSSFTMFCSSGSDFSLKSQTEHPGVAQKLNDWTPNEEENNTTIHDKTIRQMYIDTNDSRCHATFPAASIKL